MGAPEALSSLVWTLADPQGDIRCHRIQCEEDAPLWEMGEKRLIVHFNCLKDVRAKIL